MPDSGVDVLLVEDNPVNIALVEAFFSTHERYRLDTCMTGAEALKKLSENSYDIALLDMNLPDMTGLDILQHIRRDPRLKSLPAFALSADAMPEQIKRGLAAGFDQYFTKPIDFRALTAAMDAAVFRIAELQ